MLLPEGLALNLAVKEYRFGKYLKEALIGRMSDDDEQIHPGPHAYNGSYTQLHLKWEEIELEIASGVEGEDLVILVKSLRNQTYPATLVLESGILWGRIGSLSMIDDTLIASLPDREITIYSTQEPIFEPNVATQTPYLAMTLKEEIGISTGRKRTLDEIKNILHKRESEHRMIKESYGELAEIYNALQTCIAWDTIYEPKKDRVVTTVSRIWNLGNGGYVLFCWDTYFAAMMAAVDNKALAYANAIEITREITSQGFVPNCSWGTGLKSLDRSQPPVGSLAVKEIYRKFGDRWFLEEVFDDLYTWNTWFLNARSLSDGTLAWGSSPYEAVYGNYWEITGVNSTFGGALESGLDNSPMYDGIPFDADKHVMKLADVGLTGLYILDCRSLAEIADILGKDTHASELRNRMHQCSQGLCSLWDEKSGLFLNKHTDTGEFSSRLSPTNFYALFSTAVDPSQSKRMILDHFYNPEEFWGEWILPSIAKNDPAYPDQNYWRGRIWAPMNFLVYLALRQHDLSPARMDLAAKSKQLILKEWLEKGHVHENYSGETGEGCDVGNSDRFYHWGALLSLIALIEAGYVEGAEKPVRLK